MQQQDLIYRKQYMQQLYSLKDQNTIMCECLNVGIGQRNSMILREIFYRIQKKCKFTSNFE